MRAEEDAGLRIDSEGRGEGDRGAVDIIQSDCCRIVVTLNSHVRFETCLRRCQNEEVSPQSPTRDGRSICDLKPGIQYDNFILATKLTRLDEESMDMFDSTTSRNTKITPSYLQLCQRSLRTLQHPSSLSPSHRRVRALHRA